MDRYPETARKRFATREELSRIASALDAKLRTATAPKAKQYVAFLYLLIYTGARPGEIETAQRSWVSESAEGSGVLRLPDSKTGQRDVHLPPQAMEIIKSLPHSASGTICDCAQPAHIWREVRKEAGCEDLRMYPDLRRSFATVAASTGLPMSMVGQLLGHRSVQTTTIYARLMEEAATSAVAGAANKMASLLNPERG